MDEFTGASLALSSTGLAAAAGALSVSPADIWAVLSVETAGCGFLPDRRPAILFERHWFSRLTARRFDACDVSNPQPGGYGASGAAQYSRLAAAIRLDRPAALQSASWGLAQILGVNFAESGFPSVEAMVAQVCRSEDAQLSAFAAFLRCRGLDRPLRAHDWPAFARGYNGPEYARNQYEQKLAAAFTRPLPDLEVRAAQLYLSFAGQDPGPVDGLLRERTRGALFAFQFARHLRPTGRPDPATLAALVPAGG